MKRLLRWLRVQRTLWQDRHGEMVDLSGYSVEVIDNRGDAPTATISMTAVSDSRAADYMLLISTARYVRRYPIGPQLPLNTFDWESGEEKP